MKTSGFALKTLTKVSYPTLKCTKKRFLSGKKESFMPIGFTTLSAESLKSIAVPSEREIDDLARFLSLHRRVVCITGAGISTASGIPDYRGPAGSYTVATHRPITHQEFLGLPSLSPAVPTAHPHATQVKRPAVDGVKTRKRYWARALGGYERLREATPNAAHFALHTLLQRDTLRLLVTQNVDGLHHKCFADEREREKIERRIVDLHGRIDRVVCLHCHSVYHRDNIQEKIYAMNPQLDSLYRRTDRAELEKRMRADGDMDLSSLIDYNQIQVPCCERCGDGVLKPDVVFFGDNVKKEIVDSIYDNVDNADAMLIVGSSLEVFSAFRFVDRAMKRHLPIAIVNHGLTRAERKGVPSLAFRSHANCAMLLRDAVKRLNS